ncbi:GMC family oxidoreductase [Mesorhizobium sp. M1076]|uniref:GMC oxidoreductase n=1 Tax=Mesorhizobium sp. M1076 TaxID=2957054 RepID=UPI0033371260
MAVGVGSLEEDGVRGRLGDRPEVSVTDAFGKVWGHENLFVCDGSLHPTNGGYNPVLTIMALAFRNATHIANTI